MTLALFFLLGGCPIPCSMDLGIVCVYIYIFEFLSSNIYMLPISFSHKAAKDSFERRTVTKHCQYRNCHQRLSLKTAKVIVQLQAVIKDWLQRPSPRTAKFTLPSKSA